MRTIKNNDNNRQTKTIILTLICLFTFGLHITAKNPNTPGKEAPISIEIIQRGETYFATFLNDLHQNNRIGYRFFEHEPIHFGRVPLSNEEANINILKINQLENKYKKDPLVIVHNEKIEKNEHWAKQDWVFYLKPVQDGIEILLIVNTHNEGLPEYYGVQQCFRMSGSNNIEWRKKIANTPAFSEYQLWNGLPEGSTRKSLTYVLRNDQWEEIPVSDNAAGARSPLGIAIDDLRTNGRLMPEVGPYQAKMLAPIDHGLITRVDVSESWLSGIFWENTSHVTNHHPADCLHPIINIGNIPPRSKRAIRGKIYWFEGNKNDLQDHFKKDFLDTIRNNKLVIASCQFPVSDNISENNRWIEKQMKQSKVRGAELVHFPECALSGYGGADIDDFSTFDWDLLKSKTDSIMLLAKELKLWTLLGSTHPLSKGNKPHNSLYVINPEGDITDRYDKRFCTGRDLKYYTPGDHFVTFEINGVKCGLLICYDIRFPELYREYRKLGADVIFQSFYNARQRKDGIHPKIMPVTAQARAATNYFYISLTNSSAPYSWPCHFITPDGLINKKSEPDKPGVLISEIDLSTRYYDASKEFRMDAINGKLNSGKTLEDPRSQKRQAR